MNEDLYLDITVACEWALPYGFRGDKWDRKKTAERELCRYIPYYWVC